MKISCVRCGKKIDSPNVYCKECQKDMGMALGSPPRSKRRWYTYLLALVVICLVGFYFYAGNSDFLSKLSSLAGDVENTANELKQKVFGQDQGEDSMPTHNQPEVADAGVAVDVSNGFQQDQQATESGALVTTGASPTEIVEDISSGSVEVLEDIDQPTAPDAADAEVRTENAAENASASGIDTEQDRASASEEATVSGETEAEGLEKTTESVPDAAQTVSENSTGVAQEAEATEQKEIRQANELLQVGIVVYYLRNEGADVKVQKKLQEAGYTNVAVKGKWPGAFNDQNIFYRSEGQTGRKELLSVLGNNWFEYYYNSERISRTVKKIFTENDRIQFLVIPK